MPKKTQYKKRLDYNNTYNRNNYRSFSIRFNNTKEADIIDWIESKESVKEYIMNLIVDDMKANNK